MVYPSLWRRDRQVVKWQVFKPRETDQGRLSVTRETAAMTPECALRLHADPRPLGFGINVDAVAQVRRNECEALHLPVVHAPEAATSEHPENPEHHTIDFAEFDEDARSELAKRLAEAAAKHGIAFPRF